MKRLILIVLVATFAGCGGSSGGSGLPDAFDVDLPPVGECDGYDCLACASGNVCADTDTFIDGTCCAEGDSLVQLGSGTGSEVVDIEANDTYAILCGGFGARINEISDPTAPEFFGPAGDRCQHAAFGPLTAEGQIFYISHHGDSWVKSPFLGIYLIRGKNQIEEVAIIIEPNILYEGVVWRDGYLYVAAHKDGVRVYRTNPNGTPTFVATIGELGNAWKLAVSGTHAYIADNDAGIRVVDVSDPTQPVGLQTYATTGSPRDVDIRGDRLYVAMGGAGVDVFDISTPTTLTPVANIASQGSAQAVSAGDGFLAVANWSHVAIYETDKLLLVGTERTRQYPSFEQDLGVAVVGTNVYVGEWEGLYTLEYRQGFVAPDLWISEELYQFSGEEVDAKVILVRNRGRLPLVVSNAAIDHESFTLDRTSFAVAAGGGDVFELQFVPPGPGRGVSVLELTTNDPDQEHANFQVPVMTQSSGLVNVGDRLTDAWSFLDPSGAGQLSGLKGKVIVLAYFALF